jgi:hypothetical protein
MSATYDFAAGPRTRRSESGFAFSNRDSSISVFASGLKRVLEHSDKPAADLAHYAGIGLRAAELLLQGRAKSLSGPAMARLLRSRIGDRVLDLILGEQPPAWRTAELRLMGVAELEKQLEDLEQKRRRLEALIESRR